jgi:hypothetical protein
MMRYYGLRILESRIIRNIFICSTHNQHFLTPCITYWRLTAVWFIGSPLFASISALFAQQLNYWLGHKLFAWLLPSFFFPPRLSTTLSLSVWKGMSWTLCSGVRMLSCLQAANHHPSGDMMVWLPSNPNPLANTCVKTAHTEIPIQRNVAFLVLLMIMIFGTSIVIWSSVVAFCTPMDGYCPWTTIQQWETDDRLKEYLDGQVSLYL